MAKKNCLLQFSNTCWKKNISNIYRTKEGIKKSKLISNVNVVYLTESKYIGDARQMSLYYIEIKIEDTW